MSVGSKKENWEPVIKFTVKELNATSRSIFVSTVTSSLSFYNLMGHTIAWNERWIEDGE